MTDSQNSRMPPAQRSEPLLLAIDDDPDMLELIRAAAEDTGFRAIATSSFIEFRRQYLDPVAVVIVDLVMPEVDGIEVIRFLARRRCGAALIVVSSFDERVLQAATQLAAAQGLNVAGCLRKPFDPAELIRVLNRAVDSSPPARQGRRDTQGLAATDLRFLIEQAHIRPWFQPKIVVDTRQTVSVEALARCQHHRYSDVMPSQFIPMAERFGLIDDLTRAMMAECFAQLARWQRQELDFYVSINLSAQSLSRIELPDEIAALARSHDVDPRRVVFEVTESWVIGDLVTALDILTRLRLKGFDLSIDDFGTGYATLEQLKEVPFNELKLDQSFVHGARESDRARTIAELSVRLARELGLKVVAEGVETNQDWEFVQALGFDVAQGYYIARPMPPDELIVWLHAWQSRYPQSVDSPAFCK